LIITIKNNPLRIKHHIRKEIFDNPLYLNTLEQTEKECRPFLDITLKINVFPGFI